MAGKKGKHGKGRPGGLAQLILPVASTVVLATAAVHSLIDREAEHHNGHCPEPRPLHPPEEKNGLLDKVAGRFPWLKPILAVKDRYGELGGDKLAAAFTFQAFLSLFPLVLVGIAILGYVAAGSHVDVAGRLVDQLGLTGEPAKLMRDTVAAAARARQAASIVGLAGLLYSGLGLVGALQHCYNSVWQVNERGLKDKAIGIAWLLGAVVLFVGGAAITAALRWLPGFLAPVGLLVSFLVSLTLWLWTARILPNRKAGWGDLLPGAILGAVGLEVLKVAGGYYIPKAVASSSALYGSLGVIFALLAWLLIFGRLIVYSAVLNVVRYERKRGTVLAVVEAPPVPGARPLATRSGRVLTASH
jgi:membrane protein